MTKLKKAISRLRLLKELFLSNKEQYLLYWKSRKKKIYNVLRSNNVNRIKAAQLHEWKIWYNCTYYRGYMKVNGKAKKVFIKVMDDLLRDCVNNEYAVNRYIEKMSPFLAERKPVLYKKIEDKDVFCLIFSYEEIERISLTESIKSEINYALDEYRRIGIIHSDFGSVNLGAANGKLFLFDYGTALFSDSNDIRVRKGDNYNHAEHACSFAKKLIDEPDYYYDDIIHLGIEGIDRKNPNFLVGKGNVFYARLGDKTVEYSTEFVKEPSGACITRLRRKS